jgi:hypothetical protein
MAGASAPTVGGLLAHFRQYGLSEKKGYRGKLQRYGSYKSLAKDPLVEVAFDYIGEDGYVQVIEGIGYGHFADAAREDYQAHHQTGSDDE